ncbi:MAG: hypothetical protein ACYCYO_02910 [Bacilli bacterium]
MGIESYAGEHQFYSVDTLSEAYAWGEVQAQAASNARTGLPIDGNEIFGNVEQKEISGWYPSNWTVNGQNAFELNRQVIIGFVEKLFSPGHIGRVYSTNKCEHHDSNHPVKDQGTIFFICEPPNDR